MRVHVYINNFNTCKVIPEYINNSVQCNDIYFHESDNSVNIWVILLTCACINVSLFVPINSILLT